MGSPPDRQRGNKNRDRIQRGYGLALRCRKRESKWVRPPTGSVGTKTETASKEDTVSLYGAGSGGRTRTLSPGPDFESGTSANSIIPAYPYRLRAESVRCYFILSQLVRFCKKNLRKFASGGTGFAMRAAALSVRRVILLRARNISRSGEERRSPLPRNLRRTRRMAKVSARSVRNDVRRLPRVGEFAGIWANSVVLTT